MTNYIPLIHSIPMSSRPDPTSLMHSYNKKTGLIEVFNIHTGEIVAIQKTALDLFADATESRLVEMATEDGRTILVEAGISQDRIPLVHKHRAWVYSRIMQDLICERILNGESLKGICETKGFPPYSVVCHWKRVTPEFSQALDTARKDRAEYHYAEAMRIAKDTTGWTVKSDKLKIDASRWAASVDDPDRFGNKTKISGDADAPISFKLETGIRRPGDAGYNVDETAKLREAEKTLPIPPLAIEEIVSHIEIGESDDY